MAEDVSDLCGGFTTVSRSRLATRVTLTVITLVKHTDGYYLLIVRALGSLIKRMNFIQYTSKLS